MSKPYIRLYNVFTQEGEHKLSPRELYFYALLAAMKSVFLGVTHTTLSLIYRNQVAFVDNHEARRIQECKKMIMSLEQKKVISFNAESDIKANTPLIISLPVFKGGYEDVHSDIWGKVTSPEELMIFVMLKRIPGFEKSKDQWSTILGYSSKNTGNSIVSRMEQEGKIYSIEGDIYTDAQGRVKQRPTKWYIGTKPVRSEVDDMDTIDVPVIEDSMGIRWGNWKKGDLTSDDYILYVEQEDNPEFMEVAMAKLKRITNKGKNEKAVYKVSEAIEKAKEEVSIVKRRQEKERNDKKKENILKQYGICLQLKDGSIISHKDNFDWSEAKDFIYLNKDSGYSYSEVKGRYRIYEAVLPRYDYIDYETLMTEIRPYIMGEKKIDGVEEIKEEANDEYQDYSYPY